MSRQLKFRAWFEGHMYEVAKLDFWGDPEQATCDLAGENGEGEELFDIYVGEVELMQYTGLKDKNGIEIYEGDIVLGAYCWQIVYAPEYGAWSLHDRHGIVDLLSDYDVTDNNFIVIGNVFENPELLEGDNE